ncbi:MAG: lysophospholipid acyltransferase family protein [Pseudomonadales bacterium]|nr:lysophospholipid acyltransferase family protein [Pseudomonadales bacterium]
MNREISLAEAAPSAWWVRIFAALPLSWLHAFARFLAVLADRVFPYRRHVVEGNLRIAFPEFDEATLRTVIRDYYRGFADMLLEIVKSARLSRAEITERVSISNLPELERLLAVGKPVLCVAAHQCNWEWMLLSLSAQLSYPLDAAYKPLVDSWAEREMLKIRTRFGARMVPADTLLADIIKKRATPRAIAMVADQEPVNSERKHWLHFLNRDTAFFLGAEEIVRATHYAALFIELRRTGRGRYVMSFRPLATAGEKLERGEFTERYAALVEAQIRSAPPDWPWSHKRWKLKKPLYGA